MTDESSKLEREESFSSISNVNKEDVLTIQFADGEVSSIVNLIKSRKLHRFHDREYG